MVKSTLFTLVALVALSASVSAQSSATATTDSITATTTTTNSVTATTTSPGSTITSAATTPAANISSIDFSSLATLISSYDAGRSQNPGYSATAAAGSSGKSAASTYMLSEQSRGTVLIGLAMIMTTTLLAAVGTVAF
ncbi:hypothetical protein BGZ80_000297 [Entomortierella chlamydospora]|uniref:Uncharacterized protein n=1 Tax=Entomortierella chlamydospora TaxID=101097 RepID=A0A9P6MSL8_9FUNG|nr:hypothetical protein BGZ79_010542 [Entomortierella chlamydospora]KAG0011966.1 hypothetical protein BGZ80_000297 [Entomortierella chlamydospora]